MEISIKNLILYIATVLTGLSAGLFYAWAVSVIPGTKRVADPVYLETMQQINRAILNPAFYLIFFGSLILLIFSAILHFKVSDLSSWQIIAATILYLGAFLVTAAGNVPLNNALDVINLNEYSVVDSAKFRDAYESKWNRLHSIRTMLSALSFLSVLLAAFTSHKSIINF